MCVIRCMQIYANQDRHATYQWFFIGYECRVMRCQWRVMCYQGPVVRYHGCSAVLVRHFPSSVSRYVISIPCFIFFPCYASLYFVLCIIASYQCCVSLPRCCGMLIRCRGSSHQCPGRFLMPCCIPSDNILFDN